MAFFVGFFVGEMEWIRNAWVGLIGRSRQGEAWSRCASRLELFSSTARLIAS